MILTPLDVQQKTFGTALRGYDLDEVDAFLDNVVQTLKSYEDRLSVFESQQAALEAEVAKHTETGDQISRALLKAQQSADQIVDEAKGEAARMIEEARRRADEVAAKRELERSRLQIEVDNIRMGITELRTRVGGLVDSMHTDLDAMERAAAHTEAQFSFEDPIDTAAEPDDANASIDSEVENSVESDANGGPGSSGVEGIAGGDDGWHPESDEDWSESLDDELTSESHGSDLDESTESAELYDQELDAGWSDEATSPEDDHSTEVYLDVEGSEHLADQLPVRNPADWSKVDDRSSEWSRSDLDDIEPYRRDR